MKKFYFTFMLSHVLANYVKPIVAKDMETAMAKMFELYGKDWGIDFTEEQYLAAVAEGTMRPRIELETTYCEPDITTGEMFAWTNRFKNIVEAGGEMVGRRLANLMTDLETAYGIPALNNEEFNRNNPFVIQLYRSVSEARPF